MAERIEWAIQSNGVSRMPPPLVFLKGLDICSLEIICGSNFFNSVLC